MRSLAFFACALVVLSVLRGFACADGGRCGEQSPSVRESRSFFDGLPWLRYRRRQRQLGNSGRVPIRSSDAAVGRWSGDVRGRLVSRSAY